jgi:3'(2'), 5'-bisphosphate nucleotidase
MPGDDSIMDARGLDYISLADRLLPAILAAGRLEVGYFRSGLAVSHKQDASPVTIADQEAETILHAGLALAAPGIPVVAEEAAEAGNIPVVGERFFLVDPLDGTKSFISGNKDFTVNVALIENRRPTFGVIYAPATGRMFASLGPDMAIEAQVAPDSPASGFGDMQATRIRTRMPDMAALAAVASRTHGAAEAEAFLVRCGVKHRRNIGSSLKFCLVARGDADLYPRFGAIHEWDTAAGHAILKAAGGTVTLFDGAELTYGKVANRFINPDFIAWGRAELVTQLT